MQVHAHELVISGRCAFLLRPVWRRERRQKWHSKVFRARFTFHDLSRTFSLNDAFSLDKFLAVEGLLFFNRAEWPRAQQVNARNSNLTR